MRGPGTEQLGSRKSTGNGLYLPGRVVRDSARFLGDTGSNVLLIPSQVLGRWGGGHEELDNTGACYVLSKAGHLIAWGRPDWWWTSGCRVSNGG